MPKRSTILRRPSPSSTAASVCNSTTRPSSALWDLDMGFLERKPGNGEILDRLRAAEEAARAVELETVEGKCALRLSGARHAIRPLAPAERPDAACLRHRPSTRRRDLGLREPDGKGRSRNPLQYSGPGSGRNHRPSLRRRCGVRAGWPHQAFQPSLPRALGRHRGRSQAGHAYPRHRAGLRAIL